MTKEKKLQKLEKVIKSQKLDINLRGKKKKKEEPALAGVAQWIERLPMSQKITGSIPSQDTCLGCRPGPPLGGA